MSDDLAAVLSRISDRLDAIEARLDDPPVIQPTPDEEEDWTDDPDLRIIRDPEPEPALAEFPRPAQIASPGTFTTARAGGDADWAAGRAVGLTFDAPIAEGRGGGHYPTDDQFRRWQEREMFAPMRARPLEDGAR